jgi:hypothetical protein
MEFMNKDNKQPWILSGYELFSKEGQKGLKVFEVALYGAAWIHWGVGLGLLFVYYLEQKKA